MVYAIITKEGKWADTDDYRLLNEFVVLVLGRMMVYLWSGNCCLLTSGHMKKEVGDIEGDTPSAECLLCASSNTM
ncbi:hypothetical protein MKX01_005633 [Papaver californicum]|nr:hypothetical protein MKX01_005633 [Papaver californicum]